MELKNIPVVKCFIDEIHAKFWCPFCKKWHLHGSGGENGAAGHRVAHCHTTNSVFESTGYMIKEYNKKELLEIKKNVEFALNKYKSIKK